MTAFIVPDESGMLIYAPESNLLHFDYPIPDNIRSIIIYGNKIKKLNFNLLLNLQYLDVSENELISLSCNILLDYLDISFNNIKKLKLNKTPGNIRCDLIKNKKAFYKKFFYNVK